MGGVTGAPRGTEEELAQGGDVSTALGFGGWRAKGVGVLLLAIDSVFIVADRTLIVAPVFTALSLALLAAAVWIVTLRARDPFPRSLALLVAAVPPAAAAAGFAGLPVVGWGEGFATWFIGSGSFVLFALCLRGRVVDAVVSHALVAVVAGIAVHSRTGSALDAAPFVLRYTAVVLAAAVVRWTFVSALRTIHALREERAARASVEASVDSAGREREMRAALIRTIVDPVLDELATTDEPSPELRKRSAHAEASIRDLLRATALVAEPLTSAVGEARRRGVRVVLLDDSDSEHDVAVVERVVAAAAEAISARSAGTVTVRLLPPGRAELATVVGTDPVERRVVVRAEEARQQ